MSASLIVLNSQGEITCDLSIRTTYIMGCGTTTTNDGSIQVNELKGKKAWVAISKINYTGQSNNALYPILTIKDDIIYWTFRPVTTHEIAWTLIGGNPINISVDYVYGVY